AQAVRSSSDAASEQSHISVRWSGVPGRGKGILSNARLVNDVEVLFVERETGLEKQPGCERAGPLALRDVVQDRIAVERGDVRVGGVVRRHPLPQAKEAGDDIG